MTGMLQVVSINIYVLLDTSATLSFLKPLVARKFDVLSDVLIEPVSVCTLMGDSIVQKESIGNVM